MLNFKRLLNTPSTIAKKNFIEKQYSAVNFNFSAWNGEEGTDLGKLIFLSRIFPPCGAR